MGAPSRISANPPAPFRSAIKSGAQHPSSPSAVAEIGELARAGLDLVERAGVVRKHTLNIDAGR